MAEPKVGEKAPDFNLKSTSGDMVSLGQFKGQKNVLVAFFPLAFTGVCTKENCAFSEDYSKFETKDTVVLPVSVDSTPTHSEFRSKHNMKHHLLGLSARPAAPTASWRGQFSTKSAYFRVGKDAPTLEALEAELGTAATTGDLSQIESSAV